MNEEMTEEEAATERTPLTRKSQICSFSFDDEYDDREDQITIGRLVARFLSKYKWYNPYVDVDDDNAPCLDKAWAYFEHVSLVRRFCVEEHGSIRRKKQDQGVEATAAHTLTLGGSSSFRKADAGELDSPTELYPVYETPERSLCEQGIGVGMYFFFLRNMAIITLIAGIINIPLMMYYASDRYDAKGNSSLLVSFRTSAICTDQSWMACPTCTETDWTQFFPAIYDRYAEATISLAGDESSRTLRFIKVNNCDVTNEVGMVAYCSVLFVWISVFYLIFFTKLRAKEFDRDIVTASDYSIKVYNPPEDAKDPEEWKEFFSQFGHVNMITIAFNNEQLMHALIERRKLIMQLRDLQPAGKGDENLYQCDQSTFDEAVALAMTIPWYSKYMQNDAQMICKAVRDLDERITNDLLSPNKEYYVTHVFVTFEKESSQQNCLRAIRNRIIGKQVYYNDTSGVPKNVLFRGKHVLGIDRPSEPSAIRWQDLHVPLIKRILQMIWTGILTILLLAIACLIVIYFKHQFGSVAAAFAISLMSTVFTPICACLSSFESHPNEGAFQSSFFYKSTFCMWILTAIIVGIVTPFTDALKNTSESLIPQMYAIFIAELITSPIVQIVDPVGLFNRHFLGPRAIDQRRMNAYFTGTEFRIADRYIDMTTVLFLTFYYAMIFPIGFFWASATLICHYWVDKYCLLRIWAQAAEVGTTIAKLSRYTFFSAALGLYAIVASYNYSSFPYDNACELHENVPGEYVGTFQGRTIEGELVPNITIHSNDRLYKFCSQDLLRLDPPAFPAVPSRQPEGEEWMGPGQAFSSVFGWTSVWLVLFAVLNILYHSSKRLKYFLFGKVKKYKPTVLDGFSDIPDINGYIPQTKIPGALYPTLLCDIDYIDQEQTGWEDAKDVKKSRHNVIYDLPCSKVSKARKDSCFNIVRQWKPSKRGVTNGKTAHSTHHSQGNADENS